MYTGDLTVSAGSGDIVSSSSALTASTINLYSQKGIGRSWRYLNIYSANIVNANSAVNDSVGDIFINGNGNDLKIGSALVNADESLISVKTTTSGDIILQNNINNIKTINSAGSVTFSKSEETSAYSFQATSTVTASNLTIDSGVSLDAATTTFTISGDWTNNGTFNAGKSTVILTGSAPSTISGQTVFNNLSSIIQGKVISFSQGVTQTVNGILKLEGSASNPIILKSAAIGTDGSKHDEEARISVASVSDSVGHRLLRYIKVFDIDASGQASPISVLDSERGGNTTGWGFDPRATQLTILPDNLNTSVGDKITFTATVIDQFGESMSPEVIWSSSNTDVGTISSTGEFLAKGAGVTTITGTSGEASASVTITVRQHSSSSYRRVSPVVVSSTLMPVQNDNIFTEASSSVRENAAPDIYEEKAVAPTAKKTNVETGSSVQVPSLNVATSSVNTAENVKTIEKNRTDVVIEEKPHTTFVSQIKLIFKKIGSFFTRLFS